MFAHKVFLFPPKQISIRAFVCRSLKIMNESEKNMNVTGFSLFVYHTMRSLHNEGKIPIEFEDAASIARNRWLMEPSSREKYAFPKFNVFHYFPGCITIVPKHVFESVTVFFFNFGTKMDCCG
jgi:hypothetical protein